jgi:hypothetical protein
MQFMIPMCIAVGLTSALWIGMLLGRHAKRSGESPQFSIIASAMLAILGLLLGFTYSGATTRLSQRQEVVSSEASALSAAWMGADLAEEPLRGELKMLVRNFAEARLDLNKATDQKELSAIRQRLARIRLDLWDCAVRATATKPALAAHLTSACMKVFDSHDQYDSMVVRHTPGLVLGVLMTSAMAAVGSLGFGIASSEWKLRSHALVLVALIGSALWITIDMDYLRVGLIRVSDEPIQAARDAMSD